MKQTLARIFGNVSIRDCLISALLVFIIVAPATCAIQPRSGDSELEFYAS